MIASLRKLTSLYTPEKNAQVIDLHGEKSRQILITEQEYLELKCDLVYPYFKLDKPNMTMQWLNHIESGGEAWAKSQFEESIRKLKTI